MTEHTEHNDEYRDSGHPAVEPPDRSETAASRGSDAAAPAQPHTPADRPAERAGSPGRAARRAGGEGLRLAPRRTKVPSDHSSDHREPVPSSKRMGMDYLEVVRKAGVVPRLDDELMARPGQKPGFLPEPALTASLLTGALCGTQRATEISRVVAGLDPEVARELGLPDSDSGTEISYRMAVRQVRSIRKTLIAARPDPETGEPCDVASAVDRLVAASLPQAALVDVGACAVDRAVFPAWATAGRRQPEGDSGFSDGWPSYLASTVVVALPSADRTGALPWILGVSVDDASQNPGQIGLEAVRRAMRIDPHIAEVVADLAFSRRAIQFVRPLHASGIDVVMGYPRSVAEQVRAISVGGPRGNNIALTHCGTLLDSSLPHSMHVPPRTLSSADRAAWFDRRAQQYAYRPVGEVRGGDGVVHAIRFKRPTAAASGPRTVVVPIGVLDSHQANLYGTTAHQAAFARLSIAESLARRLPVGPEATGPRTRRDEDLAARAIAAAAFAVDHNLRLAERGRRARPGGSR